MSEQTDRQINGSDPEPGWQAQLLATARALPYPATPDLVQLIRRRPAPAARPARRSGRSLRLGTAGWVLAAVLIALAALLAVPPVRAGVIEFLQIGAVRIFFAPTATPVAPTAPATAPVVTPFGPSATPAALLATQRATATPLSSLLDLAGQTSLADARSRAGFDIQWPAYPADLGQPDRVYLQDLDGPAVILVWLKPTEPQQARLSLYILSAPYLADKLIYPAAKQGVPGVEVVQVNNDVAVWTTGPYVLHTRGGGVDEYRLIQGHVLIWTDGTLTYRLETDQPRDEAVRMAESLGK